MNEGHNPFYQVTREIVTMNIAAIQLYFRI